MMALTPKIVKDGTSDRRALLPPPCFIRDLICVNLRYLRTDLGGWVEIQNPKSKIQNLKSKIYNPKFKMVGRVEIRNSKFEIRFWEFG